MFGYAYFPTKKLELHSKSMNIIINIQLIN